MTESALLRATRYLSQAQAEVRRLADPHVSGFDTVSRLRQARANVVARRHEVARLEAETGGAR